MTPGVCVDDVTKVYLLVLVLTTTTTTTTDTRFCIGTT